MAGTTTYYGISYPTSTDYVKDGATAMQTIADGFDSAVAIPTYNNQTGTSYTFVLTDAGKTVTSNNASAVTFTIPPQASVAWANNTTLTVRNLGAGVVTIAGGAGVTVTNTAQTVAQYGEVKLIRTASNAWTVVPASGGASGLTLINQTTFSASSSVSVNNVFTSTYDNYRVIISVTSGSSSTDLRFRYRASGTDASGSSYYYAIPYWLSGGSSGLINSTNATSIYITGHNSAGYGGFSSMDIYRPQKADYTYAIQHGFSSFSNDVNVGGSLLNNTTQYDGFTIFPGAGTITGNVRIYGYQNS